MTRFEIYCRCVHGLVLGTNLKFYTSVGKGLKLKVRKFWGLIPIFVEVTGEKLGGELFGSPILTRAKTCIFYDYVILELFIQEFNMSIQNVMMTKQHLGK